MDREMILKMEPGRELDALVAEKVMGYTIERFTFRCDGMSEETMIWLQAENKYNQVSFSTDISAAWEVVEKMKQNEWSVTIQAYGNEPNEVTEYEVTFGFLNEKPAAAVKSAPEAICKAALIAVLDKE